MSQAIPIYQVDAFASRPFEGNPACVMPLECFLEDATLQSIASENNVAETAFIVAAGDGVWELRWFTPSVEVPLCGHATLAAAHTIWTHLGFDGEEIAFDTRKSGRLIVSRMGDGRFEMDFPASRIRQIDVTEEIKVASSCASNSDPLSDSDFRADRSVSPFHHSMPRLSPRSEAPSSPALPPEPPVPRPASSSPPRGRK